MNDHSPDYLHLLGQLAREYQEKFKELEQVCQNAQPEYVLQQLRARGELTTDQFRAAQQVLFAQLDKGQEREDKDTMRAVTTLSRCFDEMRILFSILLEYTSNPAK